MCVERGLARYSPTEEFLIVVEGSAFYDERAPEMVARGGSGSLSGTRCICEAQKTQDVSSTGGRLCRRVSPRGRDHVSGRNGRAVQVRKTEAIVSSEIKEKASVSRRTLMTEAFFFCTDGACPACCLPLLQPNHTGFSMAEIAELHCVAESRSTRSRSPMQSQETGSRRDDGGSRPRNLDQPEFRVLR